MKDIVIISATQYNETDFRNKAPLAKFLSKLDDDDYDDICFYDHISYKVFFENIKGLPTIYNESLTNRRYQNKIILFVHDDVSIEDEFLYEKLNEAMAQYNIVGLAGSTPKKIYSPALWHLMADRSTWAGAVAHRYPDDSISVSSYGPSPKRVLLLDGVFLAMDIKKVIDAGVCFDELNPAKWHLYDLDFCLAANKNKLKLGVWPIWAVHSGLGDSFQSESWKLGERWFLDKWNK